MRCPSCHADLGDGMLPACCPECGANLASGSDVRAAASDARRVARSYAAQSGPRRPGTRGNVARALVAILLVGVTAALVGYVTYLLELWGGRSLPDVQGWRVERAVEELEGEGFVARSETRKDDGQPGLVLQMSPAPGTRAPEGTQVTLVVSDQRVMPDVVGLMRDEAQRLMDEEGIPCEFVEEVSDDPEGTVLSSTSPAGTPHVSGDLVTLRVAIPRTVPQVVGTDEATAKAMLADIGVEAKVTYVETTVAADDGKVLSCDPGVGSTVYKGDTVQLTVSRYRVERLKKLGDEILRAVYDCADPSAGDAPIGAALRGYVDPTMLVSGETTAAEASNYMLWYGVVKHWQQLPAGAPEGLAALPRSVVAIEGLTATSEGHVTAAVTVRWDWSVLGSEYAGVMSTDTHYVSMDFNDQDLLTAFWDEQTDVPYYEMTTEATDEKKADGESTEGASATQDAGESAG